MRIRTKWCPQTGKKVAEWVNGDLIYYDHDYFSPQDKAPMVFGDLRAYESPIDGRVIEGRKQRRDDLARNGCRPWEGREQEEKESKRRLSEIDKKQDIKIDEFVRRAWSDLPAEKRRILRGA